jgi:hypothetical protein
MPAVNFGKMDVNDLLIQADPFEWLLLGKADSSKVVNLTNMSGCFRPEAAIQFRPILPCQ